MINTVSASAERCSDQLRITYWGNLRKNSTLACCEENCISMLPRVVGDSRQPCIASQLRASLSEYILAWTVAASDIVLKEIFS
jgi:hypothetical protein